MSVGRKQHEPAGAGAGAGQGSGVPAALPADEVGRQCTVHDGLGSMVQHLPRVMRGMRRPADEPILRDRIALGPRHGSVLALVSEQPS